jgi:epsilon-lactone hydrolase
MPSLMARLIGGLLRTTGTLRRRYSDGPDFEARIAQSRINPQLPTLKMQAALDIALEEFEGRDIWRIAPKGSTPTAHMLYFHGGGYVYPPVDVHWKFYAHLASKYGLAITAPLYPLAPESDAQATTDWAMRAYRHFIERHDGGFILGGDSAGGGLAAVVGQTVRDGGLRAPSAIILICPWLDVSVSHPDQPAIEPRDCVLTINGARSAGRRYAAALPPNNPRVSPLHGNWDGLPPILCFGGGDDILLPDARAVKAKVPGATYVEGAGLMHDWPIFFLRESRDAQAQMAQFAVAQSATG